LEKIIAGGENMDNNHRNRNVDKDFSIGEMLLRVLITSIVVAIAALQHTLPRDSP
jgi:hypothetical protein